MKCDCQHEAVCSVLEKVHEALRGMAPNPLRFLDLHPTGHYEKARNASIAFWAAAAEFVQENCIHRQKKEA